MRNIVSVDDYLLGEENSPVKHEYVDGAVFAMAGATAEHNEIAMMLGCSVGNSKSQLHKARKRLRELLHEVRHYAAHRLLEIAASGA